MGPDGRPTETVTEENFFFRLGDYQLRLLDLIESNELLISPESSRNEVLGFLRGELSTTTSEPAKTAGGNSYVPGALRDLSVSRSSFTWGIPVPEPAASKTQQKHVIYVWLDALANYMTAIGYGSEDPDDQARFAKYWPADLHLVGKEITRFHCVYWPAFLMAAGLKTPTAITANGWLLFDNSKMSKSKGNVVRTETILDAFGTEVYAKQFPESTKHEQDLFASDVLRYFLLREIPFGQDGSFSFDAMITRYNADLANGYGNLVSRTLAMISSNFGESTSIMSLNSASVPYFSGMDLVAFTRQVAEASTIETGAEDLQRAAGFDTYLEGAAWLISVVDGFITKTTPWKLAKVKTDEARKNLGVVLYTAAESIRIITALLYPILPFATANVWRQLGLGDIEAAAKTGELKNLQWGGLQPGTKLGPLSSIFPRADKGLAQIMADMEAPKAPKTFKNITDAADANTSTADDLPVTSLASEFVTPPVEHFAPTHPGAAPRTASLPRR